MKQEWHNYVCLHKGFWFDILTKNQSNFWTMLLHCKFYSRSTIATRNIGTGVVVSTTSVKSVKKRDCR